MLMTEKSILDSIIYLVEGIQQTTGIEETDDSIQDRLPQLLDELGVVRWDLQYTAHTNIIIKKDQVVTRTMMVSDKPYDEQRFEKVHFDPPNQGSVDMIYYPAKGVEWNEYEKKVLHGLWSFLYICYGRGEIFSAFDKANYTDLQTGCPNKPALYKFWGEKISRHIVSDYTIMFMNIKNLKRVNEKYGFVTGDTYLERFATYLCDAVGNEGICARMGGDNFVLVFPTKLSDEIDNKLRHIVFGLDIGGHPVEFNAKLRLGIYHIEADDTLHDIMESVTEAYKFSRMVEMPDFVEFKPYMREHGGKIRSIMEDFPTALRNNEFVAYYQPKVLVDNYMMCGGEALCRWNHNGQFISPADFIPTLEQDGSIVKLDFYMLERVCKDIVAWNKEGLKPGRISVNFSKHHLYNEHFGEQIVEMLDRYGVDHECIEVELTEMSGHENYSDMRRFVNYMKSQNIATSLDDFGTGYSSLNMLTDIGTDIVKLDKSFMDDIGLKTNVERLLVKNIINMINELGIDSLCEGVETTEQVLMLSEWECKMIQGYYFDKPMPAEQFVERLKQPQYPG